jgi:eukaryotic-like serine/threonine-protein kinase
MDPGRWDRIVELFLEARDKGGAERIALLESACGSNPSLRNAVEELLHHGEDSSSFLLECPLPQLPEAPPRLCAGKRIGRYELTAPLGRGGMGEVWQARDTELDRMVALKLLSTDVASENTARRLTLEAKAASALNHPNIVTVYEVIRHEDTVVMAMEFIQGHSLRALLKSAPDADRAAQIGIQVAQALAPAHAAGILHCDIKPENILLRPDGYVKILDFGLAHNSSRESAAYSPEVLQGTLRYMSPEQARGESLTGATDIFSFGLVLYELAAGRHPFWAESPFDTLRAILAEERPAPPSSLNPQVPAALDALILAMLEKRAAERPDLVQAARELAKIRESSGDGAQTRDRPAHGMRAAALLACLVMLGYLVWRGSARRSGNEFEDLRIQPLTAQAGWEADPAISPDGQSVAFTWSARLDLPNELYVKRIGGEEPVKLTNSPGNIGSPVWSPDGRRIAFPRKFEGSEAIYSMSSSGGSEQKIMDLAEADLSSSIDWSPDGTQLAFSDVAPALNRRAVYLYSLHTGEKRQLTFPPEGIWGDWDARFSPDGTAIAFKRVSGFWADDIYLVSTAASGLRRITFDGRGIWGHAWTADGKSLIVSCQRSSTIQGIWRFSLSDPTRPERIAQGEIDAITPASGRHSRRLAWVNQLLDFNIYRAPASGHGTPSRLIASTARDQDMVYSPSGRIAFISDRSGTRELWLANSDGSRQVQVTNFNGPIVGHAQWSSDGRRLAFDVRLNGAQNILAVECDPVELRCGQPQGLVQGMPGEAPGWSADSKFIYFASNLAGGYWEIWKQAVSGGHPVQITHHGGYLSRESFDGKWLYFTRDDSMWRTPVLTSAGGPAAEELVIGPPFHVQADGWDLSSGQIVFIDRPSESRPTAIRASNLATRQVRLIMNLNEAFPDRNDIAVAISPDARWIMYTQLDRSGANVIVAETLH